MYKKVLLIFAVCSIVVASQSVARASIEILTPKITNASFEQPDIPPPGPNPLIGQYLGNLANGTLADGFPGWSPVSLYQAVTFGVIIPSSAQITAGPTNGNQVFFSSSYPNGAAVINTRVGQTLNTLGMEVLLTANTKYTLTVDVGTRNTGGDNPLTAGYFISLLSGTTMNVLGSPVSVLSNSGTGIPNAGTWLSVSLEYTAPASGPLLGQPLRIELGSNAVAANRQTLFDNVQLTADSPAVAPEASSLVVWSILSLVIAGGAKRRMR